MFDLENQDSRDSRKTPPHPLSLLLTTWMVLWLSGKVVQTFHGVGAGHVGIKTRLGALQEEHLPEGMNIINPFFDDVYHMDIKILSVHVSCSSSSEDLQQVHAEVSLQYYVKESLAPRLYQQVGNRETMSMAIIKPGMQEGVKSVTSTYTADKLITQREMVKSDIKYAISSFVDKTLEQKGLTNAISIANVAITDFRFSHIFNQAIEAKVEAEQEALKAVNEKLTTITNAQAKASQDILAADAEAFEITAMATARAEAIEAEAAALVDNPELLSLRKIERWSGFLPTLETSTDANSFSGHLNTVATGNNV